jgi:CrcB protein
MNILVVFVGGGCGSLLRYAIGLMLPSSFIPWTTLGINVVGSFTLGLLGGLGARFGWSESVHLALTVGLCGGFTTFSTFSKEALSLAAAGRWGSFSLYAIGSVVLGLAATAVGFTCSRG